MRPDRSKAEPGYVAHPKRCMTGGMGIARLALTKKEAAESLGVSLDFFDEHIAPELRMVRRGRRRLIPVGELERWLAENADLAGGVYSGS
jgi:excisionase family DNA binding protein